MTAAKLGRHVAIVVGAATLMAGAIGCSGDEIEPTTPENDPTQSSRPSASSTPTKSTDVTPDTPTRPTGDLEDQLYAATAMFYDVINRAYVTLDTAPIAKVVATNSRAASGYLAYIEQVRSQGHSFRDVGKFEISEFSHIEDGDEATAHVTFSLYAGGVKEVDQDGKLVVEIPPSTSDVEITLRKEDRAWLVMNQVIRGE